MLLEEPDYRLGENGRGTGYERVGRRYEMGDLCFARKDHLREDLDSVWLARYTASRERILVNQKRS